MRRKDKLLLGITIGVALIDAGLAGAAYLKKKGVVIRDMALASLKKESEDVENTVSAEPDEDVVVDTVDNDKVIQIPIE